MRSCARRAGPGPPDLIGEAYVDVGPEYWINGEVIVCQDCKQALLMVDGNSVCRNDRCTRTGPVRYGDRFDPLKGVRQVKEGIRVSLVGPGQAEIRLFEALERLEADWPGLKVELWPGIDAYGIGVHFPGGATTWADLRGFEPMTVGIPSNPI